MRAAAQQAAPSFPATTRRLPLQMKARIGPVDDPLEHEADRVADAVISGRPIGTISGGPAATAQRKCAQCAAEEEKVLHRKEASHAAISQNATDAAATAIAHGGTPLTREQRAYFEPRFGRELSNIRVHQGAAEADAARRINARAYTLGSHIGFANGEYAPATENGKRLLAHELTHALQQSKNIARKPFHTRRFEDRAGGGKTDFIETVEEKPKEAGDLVEGKVDRREVVPASGDSKEQMVSSTAEGGMRPVRVRFDKSACLITLPITFQFKQEPKARDPICQEPPSATAVTPLSADRLQDIQNRYIEALKSSLNDWYAVRVEGCKANSCSGPIPIRVEPSIAASGADVVMKVVNRGGRGDAGTICVGDFDADFVAHEGGHHVLGLGDEYPETNKDYLKRNPHWGFPERVRTDLTRMGSDSSYGRFALYNERHFRFAQVFLESVFREQGCKVSLETVRSAPRDLRLELGGGFASTSFGAPLSATIFSGVGVPLERQRRLSLLIGGQGQIFRDLALSDRNALMFGFRLGLEAQTSPANFGVSGKLFASSGLLHQLKSNPSQTSGELATPARTSAYGEVGAGFGIHFGMSSGAVLHTGAEAAIGQEFSDDVKKLKWARYGLYLGVSL
jgi:Domain of unknown function (DUF4157)